MCPAWKMKRGLRRQLRDALVTHSFVGGAEQRGVYYVCTPSNTFGLDKSARLAGCRELFSSTLASARRRLSWSCSGAIIARRSQGEFLQQQQHCQFAPPAGNWHASKTSSWPWPRQQHHFAFASAARSAHACNTRIQSNVLYFSRGNFPGVFRREILHNQLRKKNGFFQYPKAFVCK